jgi:hypothetical protein
MRNKEAAPTKLGWIVRRILTPLRNAWNWAHIRLLVLKPCRVATLMVLAALAFLIVAQGQDVMRALAEQQTHDRDAWQRFFFFSGAIAWSLYAWYWARVMLFLRFPGVPESDPQLQGLRIWAPRLIGFVAMLGVAAALYLASRGYAAEEHPEVKRLLLGYAFWCLVGSVVFLAAVSLRRSLSRFAYSKLKDLAITQGRYAVPVVNVLNVRDSADEVYGTLNFVDLTPLTRRLLYAALAAAALFFLIFVFALQASAPVIGSAAIVLLAATGWIAVGSVLDFIGMRLRYPAFLTLLALAIVFSLWNDNHVVRTLPAPQSAQREDLRGALRSWLSRQQYQPAGKNDMVPLYVVNAEGGGIRAAYWTAIVLGEIQNRNHCFADQLFSISGVSGGSLGASVFVALVAEQRVGSRLALPHSPSLDWLVRYQGQGASDFKRGLSLAGGSGHSLPRSRATPAVLADRAFRPCACARGGLGARLATAYAGQKSSRRAVRPAVGRQGALDAGAVPQRHLGRDRQAPDCQQCPNRRTRRGAGFCRCRGRAALLCTAQPRAQHCSAYERALHLC